MTARSWFAIRAARTQTGEPLSFTAYVVACLARAIDEDRSMHAHPKGRGKLVLFDDVDVAVAVEHTLERARIPVPHIIRAANRKTAIEITREIGGAVTEPDHGSDTLGFGDPFFESPQIRPNCRAKRDGNEWVINGQKCPGFWKITTKLAAGSR